MKTAGGGLNYFNFARVGDSKGASATARAGVAQKSSRILCVTNLPSILLMKTAGGGLNFYNLTPESPNATVVRIRPLFNNQKGVLKMKIKLLLAFLFVSVFSFTFFAGLAGAADMSDPHGLGQDQRAMQLHFDVSIPDVAKPYLDPMSIVQFMEVKKDGQSFFAVVSVMPEDDTSDVIGATSVFCYSKKQSLTAVDIYLNHVVSIYIYKVNPQDPSKQKVDRVYVDENAPCRKSTEKK